MNKEPGYLDSQVKAVALRLANRKILKDGETIGYEAYKPDREVKYRLHINLKDGGIHPLGDIFMPYGQFITFLKGMLIALDLTYMEVD